jgi:dienelactone hydrolase
MFNRYQQMRPITIIVLCFLWLSNLGNVVFAQQRPLSIDDYPSWKAITSTALSENGQWFQYTYRPNEGDDTLFVKNLANQKVYTIPSASQGMINSSSSHLAYVLNLPIKEQEKLRAAKKPITTKVELLNLADGTKRTFANASTFQFSPDGKFLIVKKPKAEGEANPVGSDIILHQVASGKDLRIGSVSEFAYNKKSTFLAYLIDAAGRSGNGMYTIDLKTLTIHPLDTDTLQYARLVWDDEDLSSDEAKNKGNHVAFLKGYIADTSSYRSNQLVVIQNVGSTQPITTIINDRVEGFPYKHVISESGAVRFGSTGTTLYFGIRPQEKKLKKSDEPKANLDIWHWKDERIQSVQMRQLNADKNYTYTSAFTLTSGRFLQMGDDSMRTVQVLKGDRFAVGTKGRHLYKDTNWGMTLNDWYAINLSNGKQTKLATAVARPLGTSPDGKKLLYFQNQQFHVIEIATGATVNISKSAPVNFEDTNNDYPYVKPPFGLGGWTRDGKAILVYHEFDIWRLELDGSKATNVTQGLGNKDQIRFRLVNWSREDEWIDTSQPLLLSAYGEWTKKSGFYRLVVGKEPKLIYYADTMFGNPIKAKKANTVVITQQTFEQFPDFYMTTSDLSTFKRITDANPQIQQFTWGKRVLIDYKNRNGLKLQATLALPAGYEPGKQYPMLVYFYDRMSQRHHQFSMPVYDDRPHPSVYASDGYLVLMPDIVYGVGDPGNDALDAISAAVNATIEAGYADPKRIGLQGHSWGGYQSSYILTQTDMFACIVTGAPPTNLESFYNSLYRSTGTVQHGIMEVGQVRLGATPWEDPEMYRRLSPVHQAPNIKTPFMILHGDEDGAVDWMQGLELYNAARRLGKEVIFLSYPGEPHHLAKKPNQIDFQRRMKQYFDHYLKGTPAPTWMTEGLSQLEKSKQN